MASRRPERKIASGLAAAALGKILRIALPFVAASVIVGCTGLAPSTRGAPPRMFPIQEEVDFARSVSDREIYASYLEAFGDDDLQRDLRNQIIYARMYGIDQLYTDYEAQLTTERQKVGFYSTLANLALTGTGAVIVGETTKSILAASATGLTGAREAYKSDILVAKTMEILQQNMQANRKIVRAKIIERLSLSVEVYPLELALTDIEEYYRAGTITSALIGASENAVERLEEATIIEEDSVEDFITSRVTPVTSRRPQIITSRAAPVTNRGTQSITGQGSTVTDLGRRIRAFRSSNRPNGVRVREYMTARHPGVLFTDFVRDASRRTDHQRMVDALNIP